MATTTQKQSMSAGSSSSMMHAKDMIRQMTKHNKDMGSLSAKLFREEVFAAQTMKNLTARYGTRGKSAKGIFLQGFRDEVKVKGKQQFLLNLQKTGGESSKDSGQPQKGSSMSESKSSGSEKTITRPAAMVLYSKFSRRLQMLIRNQLFHFGLVTPPGETSWLHDEATQDSIKVNGELDSTTADMAFFIIPVENLLDEPEEKMILRLKVHKRAMSSLILHCEALRPLLRDIKRSYDSVLRLRDRQLLEISWLSQNISTVDKDLQEKIQNLTFEAQDIIKLMDSQCKMLMTHIDKQDAAIRIMADILNSLETSLGEEHEFRRDSDDQNKMFIKDINDIRKKLGMNPRAEEGLDTLPVEEVHSDVAKVNEFHYTPDDPLILRKALEICRHDLFLATGRVDELEELHKDEIPRRNQEQMQLDFETLKENHETLKNKKEDMSSQVQGFKNQIDKLTTERDDLKKDATELRLKITPRPSWEKVGEFVEGGIPKWKSIYEGKTSAEISNKVIEELNSKKTAAPPEYLTALGDDPEIPRCLRHDARVRDRRIGRRDAEVIINDIWKSRIHQLENISTMQDSVSRATLTEDYDGLTDDVPPLTDFPDYVADYFEEKFQNVARRMEWTYNIVDACKRLTMNEKLTKFQGCLVGKTDEGCYHLLRFELSRFHLFLIHRSLELGSEPGKMTLGDFRQLLENIYPSKNESEIKSLLRVTSKQLKAHADWTTLNYQDLFTETDEGFESDFIEEFSKQLNFDRQKFIHDIIRGLLVHLGVSYDYENHEEDVGGETDVHMKHLYTALVAVDRSIKEASIIAALAWVYLKTSILPGMSPRGSLLLTYLKTTRNAGESSDATDQAEYDKAVQEIRHGFAQPPEETDAKKNKKVGNYPKVLKLRVVIRRLKEAAILRDGTRIRTPSQLAQVSQRYLGEYPGEYEDDYMHEDEWEEEEEEEEL